MENRALCRSRTHVSPTISVSLDGDHPRLSTLIRLPLLYFYSLFLLLSHFSSFTWFNVFVVVSWWKSRTLVIKHDLSLIFLNNTGLVTWCCKYTMIRVNVETPTAVINRKMKMKDTGTTFELLLFRENSSNRISLSVVSNNQRKPKLLSFSLCRPCSRALNFKYLIVFRFRKYLAIIPVQRNFT